MHVTLGGEIKMKEQNVRSGFGQIPSFISQIWSGCKFRDTSCKGVSSAAACGCSPMEHLMPPSPRGTAELPHAAMSYRCSSVGHPKPYSFAEQILKHFSDLPAFSSPFLQVHLTAWEIFWSLMSDSFWSVAPCILAGSQGSLKSMAGNTHSQFPFFCYSTFFVIYSHWALPSKTELHAEQTPLVSPWSCAVTVLVNETAQV